MASSSSSTKRSTVLPDSFLEFCREQVASAERKDSGIWKLEAEKDGVSVYSRPVESQEGLELAFRISGVIKASVEEAFEATRNVHYKVVQKNAIEEGKVVEDHYSTPGEGGELYDIVYQRTPSPNTYIIAKREFFSARYFTEMEGKKLIFERSININDLSPQTLKTMKKIDGFNEPGAIEGTIKFSIVEFESINETSTKFEVISKMNLNGWIPMKLVNNLMKIAPQKARDDIESCIDIYRKSKK